MKKNIKTSLLTESQISKNLDNETRTQIGITVQGYFKIYDPITNEIFIGQRDI